MDLTHEERARIRKQNELEVFRMHLKRVGAAFIISFLGAIALVSLYCIIFL